MERKKTTRPKTMVASAVYTWETKILFLIQESTRMKSITKQKDRLVSLKATMKFTGMSLAVSGILK
ncbi:hypothetical protein D3C86_608680 [compost metagenome]